MIRRLVLIAYALALLILALTPPVPMPLQPDGFSLKLHHVAAFAVLTVLLWHAAQPKRQRRTLSLTLLASFAFGVVIELIQLFIPYRSGRWQDLISNAVGIALGALAVGMLRMWEHSQSRKRHQRER